MGKPRQYTLKPITIEAMQMPFEPTAKEAMVVYQWVESYIGSVSPDSRKRGVTIYPSGKMHIKTVTCERSVQLGDWVIRSDAEGFSVQEPAEFESAYELSNHERHDAIHNRENLY